MSISGQALDRDEVRQIVEQGLNAGTNDAEHEALTELADMVGLEYNEEKEKYE